jgi:hypothetical protein
VKTAVETSKSSKLGKNGQITHGTTQQQPSTCSPSLAK